MADNGKGSYSAYQKQAIYKHAEKLDRIYISVPKGRKAAYQKAAEEEGKSLTRFIVDAIEDKISKK